MCDFVPCDQSVQRVYSSGMRAIKAQGGREALFLRRCKQYTVSGEPTEGKCLTVVMATSSSAMSLRNTSDTDRRVETERGEEKRARPEPGTEQVLEQSAT